MRGFKLFGLTVLLVGLFLPALAGAGYGYSNQPPTTPGTPSTGTTLTNTTSLTWSWTMSTDPDGSISDYQIDIGTSAGGTQIVAAASTGGLISYTRTGIADGTYYARVRAVDNLGSTNSYSSNAAATVVDTTAPSFGSVSAGSVTTSGATITWTTNEGSTTQVRSGTSSGSYPNSSSANASLVASHSVTLSGLSAGTTYYYQALSTDEAGNAGTSSQGSFTTEVVTSSPASSPTSGSTSSPSSSSTSSPSSSPTATSSTTSSSASTSSPSSSSTTTSPAATESATTEIAPASDAAASVAVTTASPTLTEPTIVAVAGSSSLFLSSWWGWVLVALLALGIVWWYLHRHGALAHQQKTKEPKNE